MRICKNLHINRYPKVSSGYFLNEDESIDFKEPVTKSQRVTWCGLGEFSVSESGRGR